MKQLKKNFTFLWQKTILFLAFIFKLLFKIIFYINRKKILAIPFYSLVSFIIFVTFVIKFSGDLEYQKNLENKRINDVTQLNPIQVNKIIVPKTIPEILEGINTSTGPISIGGGKFSQGGQTAYDNSLHIDMRQFNKILYLDTVKKTVAVESGVTWRELQKYIDPFNLSVKIMQTYSDFTIGGAISVNCHGRYIGHGPIISSVLSLKLVSAQGDIILASRTENKDVFNAAIGGYGGMGIIIEATVQLVENVKVERVTKELNVADYNNFFNKNIRDNKKVIFQNGDLYPPNYDQILNVSWEKTDKELTDESRLTPADETYWLEQKAMSIISWGNTGKWFRKNIIDPIIFSSDKVVWRNKEASYNVSELEPSSRENSTYILQEYFIPVDSIKSFIPKMREIFNNNEVNVINVSLRHALPDSESYLAWAKDEVFAFVVYYKQNTDLESQKSVKKWTLEMTDAILNAHGKWYLPYQPHATLEQFNQAYPNAQEYFKVKNKVDPKHRFINKLLDKYDPELTSNIVKNRIKIDGYNRDEAQTILTVPEWYLVYNPKEYAEYLESGKNPSNFPYFESINEYWCLYDRSLKLVENSYPNNDEYKTMLQVIGISMTAEYCLKYIYEKTIGRLASFAANEYVSEEEKVIAEAQRAYSNFIYQTAWYEFDFLPWVKKVWIEPNSNNASFIRKWERKLFFTLEFTIKASYSSILGWAANVTYSEPLPNIFLTINSKDSIENDSTIQVIEENVTQKILSIKRWGAFTEALKNLANKNIIINDISGNDEIVVSVILNKSQNILNDKLNLLYESSIVTSDKLKRNVFLLNVNQLIDFINYSKTNNIILEHIYDY